MANKKIWAYAIDETGQYVKGEKHPLRVFYIWEALKLRESKIHDFNKLRFMSTQKEPARRSEMSVIKNGFYRYKVGGSNTGKDYDKDADSLSHSIAIQVLSEMDEINLVCGNDEYVLDVRDIRSDDLKLQLTNRDKYEYYYPDLICFFSSPKSLALKWGGKVAIEVRHTHACEYEKIQDFESHGVPIIEVNIENISIEKKFNTRTPTPDQLEKYYYYIKRTFANKVYGKILSDPVSSKYFNMVEEIRLKKIEELQVSLKAAAGSVFDLKSQGEADIKEIAELRMAGMSCSNMLKEKEERILEIENRGFAYYFAKKLGFTR